jgi:glycerophosphoryl diester phosphodiesterase
MIRLSQYSYNEDQWAQLSELNFKLPQVQSHRGYCEKGAKGNSLESVQSSFEMGYEMVEMDLRLNRDGGIILHHDKVLADTDLAHASTFDQVLEILPQNCFYNLEIKNESKFNFSLEEKIIQALKNNSKRNQLIFSSFNPLSLSWMRNLLPEIPRALLVTQEEEPGNSFFLRELSFLPLVKPHFLNLRWQDLDHYKEIPAERKAVWTLNDREYAQDLFDRKKVASIISDKILPTDIKA